LFHFSHVVPGAMVPIFQHEYLRIAGILTIFFKKKIFIIILFLSQEIIDRELYGHAGGRTGRTATGPAPGHFLRHPVLGAAGLGRARLAE
jgi:hypothetical protein